MRCTELQRGEVEKDLGVMISADLKCSQQCMYAYTKAKMVMGMMRRTISYKEPKIILSLYKTRLNHMLNIVLVLGIRITVRIRNCWKRYSTGTQR